MRFGPSCAPADFGVSNPAARRLSKRRETHLGHGGLATELELSLLAVLGTGGTRGAALVARVTRDTCSIACESVSGFVTLQPRRRGPGKSRGVVDSMACPRSSSIRLFAPLQHQSPLPSRSADAYASSALSFPFAEFTHPLSIVGGVQSPVVRENLAQRWEKSPTTHSLATSDTSVYQTTSFCPLCCRQDEAIYCLSLA